MDKELVNFKKLITNLIGKEELMAALEEIVKNFDAKQEKNASQLREGAEFLAENFNALKRQSDEERTAFKSDLTTNDQIRATNFETRLNRAISETRSLIQDALNEQQDGMNFIYDKVASLKDGIDGKDGKDADEARVAETVMNQLKPLFEEELTKLRNERRMFGTVGSRLGPSVIVKSLYNQSFPETPDGARTTFTLIKAPRTTGAERIYQNRTRCHPGTSNDYVVAGKVVTFNVAPLTNDVLHYDLEF